MKRLMILLALTSFLSPAAAENDALSGGDRRAEQGEQGSKYHKSRA